MNDASIEILDEKGRWRARDVSYWAGRWDQVRTQIPQFETREFRASGDTPANPYMKSVVRLPRTKVEQPVPVGTVSNTYTLAQHHEVAERCFDGIRQAGIDCDELRCDLGLTELGEWMNLRIYFPERFSHTPKDKETLALRLECFNSVDASSRLVILLGWLRFVCTNGLVIGETKTELRDIHNSNMNLNKIPGIICDALEHVQKDKERITFWESKALKQEALSPWVNETLTNEWNKKSACRVFHICETGFDVEITDPFAPGSATEKPVKQTRKVPGSPIKATNLYDVSQAMSWVTSDRNDPEEKVEWQSAIPGLIQKLAASA